MSRSDGTSVSGRSGAMSWCGGNLHFLVAATVLAISAAGWYAVAAISGAAFMKKPVTHPEGVEVDRETFRNTSLPKVFGERYVRAEDDELYAAYGQPGDADDDPDGEITLKKEVLEPLKIGTSLDKSRIDDRQCNWYVCRVYIDTNKDVGDKFKVWRLNVYYYTGVRDQVPHVGEVCLVAGGATITGSSEIALTASQCRPPWNEPVKFRKTQWRSKDKRTQKTHNYVQYYVFSMNDEPVNDRNKVRFKLMWPWVKHSYYAKIEFSPNMPISEVAATDDEAGKKANALAVAEADAAAQEFAKHFLPHVINALPTRKTIDDLDAND